MKPQRARILVVEDDLNMGLLLEENLRISGYEPMLVRDGEEALKAFRSKPFELCLLDIMLPKKDGMEVARSIRKLDARAPFIFLTARAMQVDRIEGFKLGADDYVTKPFNTEELMLRVQAVLSRTAPAKLVGNVLAIGSLSLHTVERILEGAGQEEVLSHKEAALLQILGEHINEPVSRSEILKAVWGSDNYFNSKSLDVYLTKIRKYLRSDASLQLKNIHGFGYKLVNTNPAAGQA